MAEETTRAAEAPLRFDRPAIGGAAGAGDAPGATSCSKCGTAIGAYYYEAGGAIFCARCKGTAESSASAGAGGFGRAALLGLGAAILGALGYWAFIRITDMDWAVVSVAVAVFVAKAINRGSEGRGARRFQILAVALTYLAIGGAHAPILLQAILSGSDEKRPAAAVHADSAATGDAAVAAASDSTVDGDDGAASAASTHAQGASDRKPVPFGKALLMLVAGVLIFALAGPVLSVLAGGFPGSLLSLAIIGFALHRAWRMTAAGAVAAGGHVFSGPYRVADRPPPAGA